MGPRAAFLLGQLTVLTLLRQPDHACRTRAATPVLCTQCYPLLSPAPPTCTLPDPPRLLFKEHKRLRKKSILLMLQVQVAQQQIVTGHLKADPAKCPDLTQTVWVLSLFTNQQLAPERQLRSMDPDHFSRLFNDIFGDIIHSSTVCNAKQPKYASTENRLNKARYIQAMAHSQVQKGIREEYFTGQKAWGTILLPLYKKRMEKTSISHHIYLQLHREIL